MEAAWEWAASRVAAVSMTVASMTVAFPVTMVTITATLTTWVVKDPTETMEIRMNSDLIGKTTALMVKDLMETMT